MFFDMASPVRLEDKKDYCQALSNLWSPKEWFTDYDLGIVRVGYIFTSYKAVSSQRYTGLFHFY